MVFNITFIYARYLHDICTDMHGTKSAVLTADLINEKDFNLNSNVITRRNPVNTIKLQIL